MANIIPEYQAALADGSFNAKDKMGTLGHKYDWFNPCGDRVDKSVWVTVEHPKYSVSGKLNLAHYGNHNGRRAWGKNTGQVFWTGREYAFGTIERGHDEQWLDDEGLADEYLYVSDLGITEAELFAGKSKWILAKDRYPYQEVFRTDRPFFMNHVHELDDTDENGPPPKVYGGGKTGVAVAAGASGGGMRTVGARVEIFGLVKAAKFNGMKGKVATLIDDEFVRVDIDGDKVRKLRWKNLKAA